MRTPALFLPGLAAALTSAETPTFNFPAYPTAYTPGYLIIADVNADAAPDVIAFGYNGSIEVFLNVGDGSLEALPFVAHGLETSAPPAVGDLDGDGWLDVAIPDDDIPAITVCFGDGTGAFVDCTTIPAGSAPAGVALAGFDGDGDLDYAFTDEDGSSIEIRLNSGDGLPLQGALTLPSARPGPGPIVAADFDGDGDVDLAYGSSSAIGLVVLYNDGDGLSFTRPPWITSGIEPTSLAIADLNADSLPDIVALDHDDIQLGSFLNHGDRFSLEAQISLEGAQGGNLAVGDLNGDGLDDVLAGSSGDSPLYEFINDGEGGFITRPIPNGSASRDVALGDLDGDGLLDAALSPASGFMVLFGTDPEGLAPRPIIQQPTTGFARLRTADLNLDQIPDTVTFETVNIYPLLGSPFEPPARPETYPDPNALGIAVGDLNNDGIPDLAFTHDTVSGDRIGWAVGIGDGTYLPASYAPALSNIRGICLVDFDDDGDLDIAVTSFSESKVQLFENLGALFFSPHTELAMPGSPFGIAAEDFDLDGIDDLCVVSDEGFPSTLSILYGDAAGGFPMRDEWVVGDNPGERSATGFVIADFNADGFPDVATAEDSGITLRLSDGFGSLPFRADLAIGQDFDDVTAADFNLDGRMDLAATIFEDSRVIVFYAREIGFGYEQVNYYAGEQPYGIVAADFNVDSAPDLLISTEGGELQMLYNTLAEPCPGDYAAPFGVLNFDDALSFLVAFAQERDGADLAEPIGVWNFSDVFAFLVSFGSGCP